MKTLKISNVVYVAMLLYSMATNGQTLYVPGGTVGTSSNGNVGIGTNAPNSLMDIRKAITPDVINKLAYFGYSGSMNRSIAIQQIGTPAGANQYIFFNGELGSSSTFAAPTLSTSYEYPIGLEYKTNLFSIVYSPTSGAINAAIQNGFCFQPSSGRVGIGTSTPVSRLHVNGDITIDAPLGAGTTWATIQGRRNGINLNSIQFRCNSDAGASPHIVFGGGGEVYFQMQTRWQNAGTNYALMTAGGKLRLGDGNTPVNQLEVIGNTYLSGNVGIGLTNPGAKLDVAGSVKLSDMLYAGSVKLSDMLYIVPSGGTRIGRILFQSSTESFQIGEGGGFPNDFLISDNNPCCNTRLFISGSTGNVGIGTLNPTQKLTVNGKILAEEVEVVADVPDYVFKEDYKLMSLAELDKFIKANKHLPEVPSEKEVCDNGSKIGLGEMNHILLKKIEELTLYTIDQENNIKEQKENSQKQDEVIKKLLKRVTELEKQ